MMTIESVAGQILMAEHMEGCVDITGTGPQGPETMVGSVQSETGSARSFELGHGLTCVGHSAVHGKAQDYLSPGFVASRQPQVGDVTQNVLVAIFYQLPQEPFGAVDVASFVPSVGDREPSGVGRADGHPLISLGQSKEHDLHAFALNINSA